jgi:hypothetical protein
MTTPIHRIWKKRRNPIELACFSSNSQVVATTHLTTDLDNSDVINVVKLWTRKGELINLLYITEISSINQPYRL